MREFVRGDVGRHPSRSHPIERRVHQLPRRALAVGVHDGAPTAAQVPRRRRAFHLTLRPASRDGRAGGGGSGTGGRTRLEVPVRAIVVPFPEADVAAVHTHVKSVLDTLLPPGTVWFQVSRTLSQ